MIETNNYTVIFLVDQFPAKNILLLKRASTKLFAPDYYTGIGGKVGDMPHFQNETILEGAYRELSEETLGSVKKDAVQLLEFARFRYKDGISLFYFVGLYPYYPTLPAIDPSDGCLEWVPSTNLLQHNIIPTTKIICEQWTHFNFVCDKPFTVHGLETGKENGIRLVRTLKVLSGLY